MPQVPPEKLRIGRSLLAGGPVTHQLLQRELERSGKGNSVLGKALLQSGFPQEQDLVVPLLSRLRIPKINAKNTKIPLETIRLIPEDVAKRSRVLAIDQIGSILVVVTPDLGNEEGVAEVRRVTGNVVTPIQCSADGFDGIVADYYRRLAESGLAPVTPVTGVSGEGGTAASNGVVKAIPAGDAREDAWFKRYMTSGPLPAEEPPM